MARPVPTASSIIYDAITGEGQLQIKWDGATAHVVIVYEPPNQLTGTLTLTGECGFEVVSFSPAYGSATWDGVSDFTDDTVGPLSFSGSATIFEEVFPTEHFKNDAQWTFTRGS